MKNCEEAEVIPINLGAVNVFLLRGKRCILVDAGYPGQHKKILNVLKKMSISPDCIDLIVITHGHWDHYGGAGALADITGAKILIHKQDADQMAQGHNGRVVATGILAAFMKKIVNRKVGMGKRSQKNEIARQADIMIEAETDLKPYGFNGKIITTPGHTGGSLSVLTARREVMIGDLLMAFVPGGPRKPLFADDLKKIKTSLETLINMGGVIFYLSHGKRCHLNDIQKALRRDFPDKTSYS